MTTAETETDDTQQEQDEQQTAPGTTEGDESDEQTSGATPGSTDEGDEEKGEVVVTIGEDSPPSDTEEEAAASAAQWVKDLRKTSKEQAKRIRDLEAENAKLKAPAQADAEAPGEEPTLEGADFDPAKFKADYAEWLERKRKHEAKQAEKAKAEEEAQATYRAKLDAYGTAKTALKVADFDEAEEAARAVLSVTQQGIIVHGAKNPAALVYALGKYPERLKELAAISDPVQFAFAAAALETQLQVKPRKAPPPPERKLAKGTSAATGVDSQLESLRADAARTGDFSKVLAYKQAQRNRG